MVRKYEQTLRAEKQEQTRLRIIEAAVELHGTVGPAATSLSAVAERAGVQRNTLYRHFPDTRTLLQACSGHYGGLHPFPDVEGLADISDPLERARTGLRTLYAYYQETEPMMTLVLRDAQINDDVAEVSDDWTRQPLHTLSEVVGSAWPRRGPQKQRTAAVNLALSFRTWQTLVGSGLSSTTAADLMARSLDCACGVER